MKILYVDDNPDYQRRLKSAFKGVFSDMSFEVIENVDDAIDELQSKPKHYDVVVIDLLFPSIDNTEKLTSRGLEIIPVARSSNPKIVVIAISQDSDQKEIAVNHGADLFVYKGKLAEHPGTWDELGIKTKELLEQRNTVFIGHGRSSEWRKVSEFLNSRLELEYDEFNREATAGVAISERLQAMLNKSSFALLIMTAEDEQTDGKLNPRMNVVHEAGLFQGRLGFSRAIVLLEETCEEFSNIHGLGQIRFQKGKVESAFEDIRRVLEREGFV